MTYNFNPVVPAEQEFIPVDVSIAILVKHGEDVSTLLIIQGVDVTFVIAEEGSANQPKLVWTQSAITEIHIHTLKQY